LLLCTKIDRSILFGFDLLAFSRTFEGTVVTFVVASGHVLGSSLWFYGIRHINLSKATSIVIVYPLIAAVLAILMLGEDLTLAKIVGASFVFLSTLKLSRFRSISREQSIEK
jgi:drug/metabolite transporter (DMT)-like permease